MAWLVFLREDTVVSKICGALQAFKTRSRVVAAPLSFPRQSCPVQPRVFSYMYVYVLILERELYLRE